MRAPLAGGLRDKQVAPSVGCQPARAQSRPQPRPGVAPGGGRRLKRRPTNGGRQTIDSMGLNRLRQRAHKTRRLVCPKGGALCSPPRPPTELHWRRPAAGSLFVLALRRHSPPVYYSHTRRASPDSARLGSARLGSASCRRRRSRRVVSAPVCGSAPSSAAARRLAGGPADAPAAD